MYATGELKGCTLEITLPHHIAELYFEMGHCPITGNFIISMFLFRIIAILFVRVVAHMMTTVTTMRTRTRDVLRNNHHVQVSFLATLTVHFTYIHAYRT